MIIKNVQNEIVSIEYFATQCQGKYVFICWDIILPYFVDYIDSLDAFSFYITFDVDEVHQLVPFTQFYNKTQFVYPTNVHMPRMVDFALQPNCFLFNCEQMTIPERLQLVVGFLKKGGKLFDYNSKNCEILLQQEPDAKVLYLPYRCTSRECATLQSLLDADSGKKEYDVAVVASMTERRERIVRKLEDAGIRVLVIRNKFGVERDTLIAKCQYLLNIHANDNYNVFETLRCLRWMNAGLVVISEPCTGIDINGANEHPNLKIVPEDELNDFLHLNRGQSSVAPSNQIIEYGASPIKQLNEWVGINFSFGYFGDVNFCYGSGNRFFRVMEDFSGEKMQIRKNLNFNTLFGDPTPNAPKRLIIVFEDVCHSFPERRDRDYYITFSNSSISIQR